VSRDLRIVPWLAPLGLPQRELDALLFRTAIGLKLPLVGRALAHWEACYRVTSTLLDPEHGALVTPLPPPRPSTVWSELAKLADRIPPERRALSGVRSLLRPRR